MNPVPHTANDFPVLLPGDILLYGDRSLLSWAIRTRTWADVSHVEVYVEDGRSIASRSEGVAVYPLRILGLRRVIRPVAPFDLAKGMEWFKTVDGTHYGWLDMFRFYGIDVPTKGLICSQLVDLFFQNCGLALFNLDYPEGAVTPRDYELLSPLLATEIWSWK